MNRPKVLLIECKSSAINYIEDCRKMGYEPVLMEMYVPPEWVSFTRSVLYRNLRNMNETNIPEIIDAPKSYEDTLEMVRKMHPAAVIPGQDIAVELAMRLAHDLQLPCNDPSLIKTFRYKDLCQQALQKHGVRSIRGKIVSSLNEALEFFKESGCKRVIVKPNSGVGTRGVYVCDNEEQVTEAFNINASGINYTTLASEDVLIQEYIDGVEYVINTVTYHGVHKVTGAFVYKKSVIPGVGPIYDTTETIPMNSSVVRELTDYMFKALDAIGVCVGPVHSELKIDDMGPVLIESNFRPCGHSMRGAWVQKVFGNRETDIALLSYLNPEKFLADKRDIIACGKYQGIIKTLRIPYDLKVKRPLFHEKFKHLPGYEYSQDKGDNTVYKRTVDLITDGGIIAFASPDYETISHSVEIVRDIELNDIESLFELEEI